MSRSSKTITDEIIWQHTNNGLYVFEREISRFRLGRKFKHPLFNDTNPSSVVKQSSTSGLYIIVDYGGDQPPMNAISFIGAKYGLDYRESIQKIAGDFGITQEVLNKNPIIQYVPPTIKPSEPIIYEYEGIPFKKKHHLYWNQGELTEEFLRENNVFAASKIAINKKVIKIPSNELCFVYVPEDLPYGNLKILRIGPEVPPEQKWRSNIPNEYLWSFHKYEDSYLDDNLWVIKSRKDELVAKLLGLNTISVQSENAQVLNSNMKRITPITKNVVINYGSDIDGVKKCREVQQNWNCLYYNTPKSLLPEVNDLFSYVSHMSLRQLERHIKSKKLL